jgi:hypothetical protein
VAEKVRHTILSGSRIVYIPAANAEVIDQQPTLHKLAAEHEARIVPVERFGEVCGKLFPPEGSGRLRDTLTDTANNMLEILCPTQRPRVKETVDSSAHKQHRCHVLVCSVFAASLVFLEGWMLYKMFSPAYPLVGAWGRIIGASVIIFVGMWVCFALPGACLRHRKSWSWLAGTGLLAIAFAAVVLLLAPMLPQTTHISRIHNLPPAANLLKDIFVIWIFCWAVATNTFNATAALEYLVAKRQFVTARICLRWDSPLESRMPIRCIHFPWNWGVVCIAVVALFLIVLELNYYASLRSGTAAAYWASFLGFGRDLIFITALAEVMVFYKVAVASVRRMIS